MSSITSFATTKIQNSQHVCYKFVQHVKEMENNIK